MSKMFEALQRLERESGALSADFAAEAQVLLQSPTVEEAPASALEEHAATDPNDSFSTLISPPADYLAPKDDLAATFSLEQIQSENALLKPESRLVFFADPHGAGADRFRLLRMRLQSVWDTGRLKHLLITSPLAQEGKSTVALNLATALAEQGKRSVLLVEGDLRRPVLCSRLGLIAWPGLAECLDGGLNPISALRRIEPLGWYLLPAGSARGNPTELLQSESLSSVMTALASHFDWILIDSPPAVPLADTPVLKQYTDASLLVVRAGSTPDESIEAAIARLGSKHILGMILNGAEELDQLYSRYYGRAGLNH
jgi:capsular exopolysaccharide synthesis family protein